MICDVVFSVLVPNLYVKAPAAEASEALKLKLVELTPPESTYTSTGVLTVKEFAVVLLLTPVASAPNIDTFPKFRPALGVDGDVRLTPLLSDMNISTIPPLCCMDPLITPVATI